MLASRLRFIGVDIALYLLMMLKIGANVLIILIVLKTSYEK